MIILKTVESDLVWKLTLLGGNVPTHSLPFKIAVLLLWVVPSAEFVSRVHHAKQVDFLSRLYSD